MLAIMRDMEARFEARLRQMETRILSRRQEPATPRGPAMNPTNNVGNSGKPAEDPPRRPGPPVGPTTGNVQILQRPRTQQQAALTERQDNPTKPPATNTAIKQTWAAITATGIDLDGFRLAPTRKRNTGKAPGIGQKPEQALSAPSTPHARQRRLIIRSVEKNRRVGRAGVTPANIRDVVNGATHTKFAFAEYNRQDELVLTTMENTPAEPALRDLGNITKALNNLDIYGFDISLDMPTVNIVINSLPLGDSEWTTEDWDLNSEKWSELEGEITTYNPGIRIMDRPKWIKSPSALLVEKKEKSSIIVAVQATEWIREQLTRERPYLALFGERCSC